MSGKRHKKELWLDPRAKLFLILMCVLSSMFAPSLAYQFILVMLIAILGAFFGKWKYVIIVTSKTFYGSWLNAGSLFFYKTRVQISSTDFCTLFFCQRSRWATQERRLNCLRSFTFKI